MESFDRPLRRLHNDASWFARARELRLLHVTCSSTLRASALRVLLAAEFHADNRSPFVALEDACLVTDTGWEARAKRVVRHWEERFAASILDGLELGELNREPLSAPPGSLAAFGAWLHRVLGALRPPLDGLVVVLAPTRVDDATSFERDLTELMRRPELRPIRWIVLHFDDAPLTDLVAALGNSALSSTCIEDPDELTRDLATLASGMDPMATGHARAGAAWPRGVHPPTRPGEVAPTRAQEEERDIELAAAGVNAALAGPDGTRMQKHMLGAVAAMRAGAGESAVREQHMAVRIAYEAGATREALLQHLVLAGYYHALGHPSDAEREYAAVAERARMWSCQVEEAQAELAQALIALQAKRQPEAAEHYARAADAAQRAKAPTLAIECWRLAGQLAAEAGLESRASECWARALELVADATPELARASSAPHAARQLAALLRRQGLLAQADSLEHQANVLETTGAPPAGLN